MTLLYEWEVIAGFGAAEHVGPCGVTDSEHEARRQVGRALRAATSGVGVRGRITVVVLRHDCPELGYERGRRVAVARREPRGLISWTTLRPTLPSAACW